LLNRPRGRCTSLPLERTPRHRWARGSGVRERRLSPGRRRRLHLLHRRRHLRLSRRSVELRHRSLLHSWLLELRLRRHLVLRQRLRILHRLRRRRRILVGHRSRLLIDRLALLHRLILILNRRLLLLWRLQLLHRLRLRLPISRLRRRLRHRRGRVLAVVVHADSGMLSERLVASD